MKFKHFALMAAILLLLGTVPAIRWLDNNTEWLRGIVVNPCYAQNDPTIGVTASRPDYGPSQVHEPQEIVNGDEYIVVDGEGTKTLIVADSQAYRDWHGRWSVKYRLAGSSTRLTQLLSDWSVVSYYQPACWNRHNHLEFTAD